MAETDLTTTKYKVLLVEDDQFVRDLYSRKLRSDGFEVILAANGEDGLREANNQDFDIILLDIMLPKMTGLDVLHKLKRNEKTKDTPIFLMTNLGQEGIIHEAFKIGVTGYFLKTSMLPKDVSNHVRKYLEKGEIPQRARAI